MTQQEFFTRYTYNTRTDKIGGGSFGTVYKAYDNKLSDYVAIKISEVKSIAGKEFSLIDEFNAIKGLEVHENIAKYEQLYTFDQPNGVFDYAIIKYYQDGNLKTLMENGSLSQTQKENIAIKLLQGLSFLHKNKVVHRDMKPSNILIVKKDNEYIPKIADFGLSKKADPNAKSRFTNSFGGGTLEYSSPEQLKGQNLRFNTDLWAWAVIVYELFTEKSLFQPKNSNTASAENEKEIFEQILNKDITISLNEIPTNLSNALLACLNRNPDTRIKSAEEIFDILNNSNLEYDTIVEKPKPQPKGDETKPFEEAKDTVEKKKSYKFLYITTSILIIVLFFLNAWFVPFEKYEAFNNENIKGIKTNWFGLKNIYYENDSIESSEGFIFNNVEDLGLDNLVLVENGNKYKEKYLLNVEHKSRPGYIGNLIQAKSKNKYGLVNNEGKIVIPIKYDTIYNFNDTIVKASLKANLIYFDKNGNNILDINTIGLQTKKNDEINIELIKINKNIENISPKHKPATNWRKYYDKIYPFKEGLAMVQKNDKYGYVDKEGKLIIPLIYYGGRDFSEGLALVLKKNLKRGYIDKNNKIIIPMIYDDGVDFENGLVIVNYQGNYYTINKKGECVKDCPN